MAFGAAVGTASLLWAAFATGSVGYLPVFMLGFWIVGGFVGAVSALLGLVAWNVLSGASRWPVAAATAAAGTMLWFLWLLLDYEGWAKVVWPGTLIAAVLMLGFGVTLVRSAKLTRAPQ
ncbi:hypothetical protein [Gryllotalpicola ginsengisoli]|uniref:hypothetical protein n=1 Tax=Gryllotalpicola ginsengisoli TaxID=444608 RepID=UPI0003B6FC04|nr:hypothetical protein [Gryllotalpicola ginsengisoli]